MSDDQPAKPASPNAGNEYARLTEQASFMLTREDRDWIEAQRAERGVSRGQILRECIATERRERAKIEEAMTNFREFTTHGGTWTEVSE